jgi:hypothetical protein
LSGKDIENFKQNAIINQKNIHSWRDALWEMGGENDVTDKEWLYD